MKKLSYFLMLGVVLGLLDLSCGETPNPLQAPLTQEKVVNNLAKAEPTKEKYRDSFPYVYFDACTGENILLNVQVTTFIFNSFDGHGSYHGHFLQQWHITGVGETSGIKYVGPQTDQGDKFVSSSNGTFIGTYTENWMVISQGATDNIRGGALSHITINANGEVTRYFELTRFECKG